MKRIFTALAVTLALVGGACGGDGSSGGDVSAQKSAKRELTPREVVLATSTKTAEAKSSRLTFHVDVTGSPQLPEGLKMTGDGAFDYAERQGRMTLNIPRVAGVEFGRIEAVFVGNTIYEKFPPNIAQFLGGKPWLKIDIATLSKTAGVDFNTLVQAQSSDPTQALQFLNGAADDVSVVGKEQLRGDDVTHYRATIDFDRAAASAPAEQQAAIRQVAQIYAGLKVPTDVWVDGDNRLRKMTYVMDLSKLQFPPESAAAKGTKLTGQMTYAMELFDFGTKVEAVEPPADQVTDFSQLMSGAGAR